MSIGKFVVGWLGITTLCALGAHFIYPNRDGLAAKLQAKADSVKTEQFADWATITFKPEGKLRSRIAYISGPAPSEEAKTALEAGILSKHGMLSVASGGIKKVIFVDGAAQPLAQTDYTFRAEVTGDKVVLTGVVPSQEIREELLKSAQEQFANRKLNVVDEMTVRPGTSQTGWADVAKRGMGYVVTLGNQYAELSGSVLAVVGKASDSAMKLKIEEEIANGLPSEFQGRATIEGPAEMAVAPAVQAQVDTCQSDMNAAMLGKTIEFATNQAVLRETPNSLLDSIVSVAGKCPKTKIEISGHTDSRGGDAANMKLSQARAETVQTYLVSKGISADRLSAAGKGETTLLDSSDTLEAHQKNRRIEFKVSADNAAQ